MIADEMNIKYKHLDLENVKRPNLVWRRGCW